MTEETKHTAEEWFWSVDSQDRPTSLRKSGGGDLVIDAQADIGDYGLSVNPWIDISEMDANRIALLPAILAALKSLVDHDLTYNGASVVIPAASHADAIAIVSRARSVLAKAEGSPQ